MTVTLCILLVVANVINIAADLGGMAEAAKMVTGAALDVDAGEPLVSQDWGGYVKRRKEEVARRRSL